MIPNVTLFVVVTLLTVGCIHKATANAVAIIESRQDPENTCYLVGSCKPTKSVDNPFNN